MRLYLKYLWVVTRHRWYVMLECFKRGLIWRGLKHDLSKYRPREFFAYAKYFSGDRKTRPAYYKPYDTGDKDFDRAWLFHQCSNDHHWQWWCVPHDEGDGFEVHEMSPSARVEMFCDWIGAGKAYNGASSPIKWYLANSKNLQLHPNTREEIEFMMGIFRKDDTK